MLTPARKRLRLEILIVLGLSLGQSAVYSVVQLADKMSQGPLSQSTSTLNASRNNREFFDALYQLLDIGFSLVPVLLVIYFLAGEGPGALARLGLKRGSLGSLVKDVLTGLVLAAVLGAGTLALYAAGRAAGITTAIIPSALDAHWWTVPVLILSAVRHSILEEVIVVGYLLARWEKLGWRVPAAIIVSSLLRGSYHLYQGFGPFIGNVVMGLLFAWLYSRQCRLVPLLVAHALLDIAAFVGFSLFGKAIGLG
ncbi:CPBP family intramembrane glutamic endopeptidase [Pseudarthrobacter sp. J1763]|uniref:CPBP family intramembrane glutamic endopeptidase n=1 Tax=Pseudarthrobacter sp. J1763 TaxID=3420445 RepID=UPI003D27AF6A